MGSAGQDRLRLGRRQRVVKAKVCASCGLVHERCSGHADVYDEGGFEGGNKIGERPCRHWPMHGQSVCQTHGGKGRNRKVGKETWEKERKMAAEMDRLERAVKTYGLPVTVDPQTALLDEIYRTAGHVKWLGEQIAALDPKDLVWGVGSEEKREGVGEMETQIDLTTTTKIARPAAMVQMYQAERAHLVHVCKTAIQCGIAERQIKLAEEQGQMIAAGFRQVVESPELALTEVQITIARTMVSQVLRTMSLSSRPALPPPAGSNGSR